MTASRQLECLGCGASLDQREEHGVTIDYCPTCGGIWLDPGELEQLTGHSSHTRDIDIDIEAEEEEEDDVEDDGILGTIASALGAEFEDDEYDEEYEEEFEMEAGFEEEEEF